MVMKTILVLLVCCYGTLAQFNAAGIQKAVDAHNKFRSQLAKGQVNAKGTQKASATNMRKMKWDASLAASAQKWTNTCPTEHSHWEGLGENIWWTFSLFPITSLEKYGADAAATWWKEFADFGFPYNKMDQALFNSGVGHASQMAWADSSLLGCGVKDCGKVNGLYKVIVTCQYKTPGNYMGEEIYKSGPTCSACPSGTSCEQSTGLCQ